MSRLNARAGPTPPVAPPTSCVLDGGAGALRRGQGTTHGAGFDSGSIPTLSSPSAAKWVSAAPSPSASTKACGS